MKALRIHEFGGPEVVRWEEVPDPGQPGHGQVRVRVRAGALNHLDLWVRRRLPGVPVVLPLIQGCDMAGEVEACGQDVSGLSVGDRVFLQPGYGCGHCNWCRSGKIHYCADYGIYGETCNGNFCDVVLRPAANLFRIPATLGWEGAAALPLVSLTAWEMLRHKARLGPGETLLVLGASSGVGSMAVQMGKILGARVIAVTSEKHLQRVTELGADDVIDRGAVPEFSREVKKLTGGALADVVFEHTGEATLGQSLRSLARGGRLVTCGGTTGPKLEIDVRHLFSKQWTLMGSTMGGQGAFDEILPLVERGALRPVVGEVLPMSEGREAQARLESGAVTGKMVLVNNSAFGSC